ncbi:Pol polyprotein [Vitis vinifera]|uniref:Pol polyprotein n=1 Tax=Vitis vinifera TaxID=29760 RepID=A0A438DCG7_VITVI|nr:Pol polyprotein [Vitis vinifera]
MKGQVMADFVLEYSRRPSQHHESIPNWGTFGASHPAGFSASNNEAEYEAILSGLDLALALSVSKLRIYSDSQLVVKHVQEEYEAKDARMARYLAKVRNTLQQFTEWTIEKIKRADNRRADALAGIAASLPSKKPFYCLYMCKPTLLSQKPPLATPLRQPKQTTKNGRTICRISPDRHSTRRSQTGTQNPGASCPFHPDWGAPVQAILHRTLPSVPRAFRGPVCSHSTYAISNVEISLRPMAFCTMGHGYSGPLPAAPAQKKFLLVATDYFSKWVEAEAYASIKDKDVTKFVWKNIVCRFGIPQTIIADNGPQFDSIAFRNFCSELNIRNSYSTPRYPQSNGQAEATNKTLITALKKRLEQAKGKWVESYPASYGPIEPHPDDQQETLLSPSHMEWMQSFLLK